MVRYVARMNYFRERHDCSSCHLIVIWTTDIYMVDEDLNKVIHEMIYFGSIEN